MAGSEIEATLAEVQALGRRVLPAGKVYGPHMSVEGSTVLERDGGRVAVRAAAAGLGDARPAMDLERALLKLLKQLLEAP